MAQVLGSGLRVALSSMEADAEYTVWERPNGTSIKGTAGPFSIVGTTKLEARENRTLVTAARQVEASGIMKLTEGLVIRQAKKARYKQLQYAQNSAGSGLLP